MRGRPRIRQLQRFRSITFLDGGFSTSRSNCDSVGEISALPGHHMRAYPLQRRYKGARLFTALPGHTYRLLIGKAPPHFPVSWHLSAIGAGKGPTATALAGEEPLHHRPRAALPGHQTPQLKRNRSTSQSGLLACVPHFPVICQKQGTGFREDAVSSVSDDRWTPILSATDSTSRSSSCVSSGRRQNCGREQSHSLDMPYLSVDGDIIIAPEGELRNAPDGNHSTSRSF